MSVLLSLEAPKYQVSLDYIAKLSQNTDGLRGWMDGQMDGRTNGRMDGYVIWGSTTAPQRAHLWSLEHLSKGSLRYFTRKQNRCERYLTGCVLLSTSLQGDMVH